MSSGCQIRKGPREGPFLLERMGGRFPRLVRERIEARAAIGGESGPSGRAGSPTYFS